jgi:probable F420-dependent oxidoreductase
MAEQVGQAGEGLQIDAVLHGKDLTQVGAEAAQAERCGHDAVWVTEEGTDPFLHALAAGQATRSCATGTGIAVAFARSPMIVAQAAWQLADASQGRFILGLGSQVRAHIERRYSMPWHGPIDQMRDYLESLRAIWHSWRSGEGLDHKGPIYEHSLSAPFWTPNYHGYTIPTYLAAVGPRMVELAGELADGVMLHPFSNRTYEDTVLRPGLEAGLAVSGRALRDFDVSRPLFMVMGDNEEQLLRRRRDACEKLSFYASTRAYAPVLAAIGLGDLQPDLARLAREQRWPEMADLVDEEVLEHFAIIGAPEEMPHLTRNHVSGFVTRVSSYLGWPIDDEDRLRAVLAGFATAMPMSS